MTSSLLSLGARKAVDELATHPGEFAERFLDFPPEEQQVLLKQMAKRIGELKEVEQKWNNLNESMPATDIEIHKSRSPAIPGENEEEEGFYAQWDEQDRLRKIWHWVKEVNRKNLDSGKEWCGRTKQTA
jgi:hypothetical protein